MKKTKLTLRKLSNVLSKKAPQNDVISALGDSDRAVVYSDCKKGEDCIVSHLHVNGDDGNDDDGDMGRLAYPKPFTTIVHFTFDEKWQNNITLEIKHATDPKQDKLTFIITKPEGTPSNNINLGALLNKGETYNMKVVFSGVKYETLFQIKE